MLNPPRYKYLVEETKKGTLPVVRDEQLDKKIKLDFEVPKDIKDEDCAEWISKHTDEIVRRWRECR
ncbi:MAG: hypothetical protein KatS3mg101_0963 [Patescibacteria group bacterium]|nr:MAG: hypothetical protein KatS3mg101_0963 [Patescibacteria group bacterium]